jgi:YtkA-like
MPRLVPLLALGALLLSAPALAAPPPALSIEVDGSAYARSITVRVTSPAGKAVTGATVAVSASMNAPGHFMSVAARRAGSTGRGVYRTRLQFPMLGRWTIHVHVEAAGLARVTRRVTIGL